MAVILSIVIFLPLAGAVLCAFLPGNEPTQHRGIAVTFSVAAFLLSLALWFAFDAAPGAAEFQFEAKLPWIDSVGIGYHIGLDGVALLLVMLTTVLMPVVVL